MKKKKFKIDPLMRIAAWCMIRFYRKRGFVKRAAVGNAISQMLYECYRSLDAKARAVLVISIPEKGKTIDFFAIPRGGGKKELANMCWAGYQHFTGHGGEIKVKK